ncbi:MAG: leucine-rich repeat domain-containing protein, partial [Clostridia bacterium]|nr:leucine-rich repeat domain-containing protein [Clostridia bacterium]
YSTENKIDLFFEFDDDIDYIVSVRAYSDNDKGERVFGERSEPLTYAVPVLPAGSYAYAPSSDGSGYRIKLADPSKVQGKFVIPMEINETMVTQIAVAGFLEATSLTGVIVSDYVTDIGNRAFMACTSLKMCRLPDYLANVNTEVFSDCISLEKIIFNDQLKKIGTDSFKNCSSLEELDLPNGLEELGDRCFYGCAAVKEITIPDKLKTIRNFSFVGCALKTIKIGEDNEKYYVEGNCLIERETKTLVLGTDNSIIPDDVPVIGAGAFAGRAFETITIPETVVEIEGSAFNACKNLKEITLPKELKVLGGNCFAQCYALKEITVPSKVKELQVNCFFACSSLKKVTIENGVKTIGVSAFGQVSEVFGECEALTEIYIPASVEKIGGRAFNNMINLESIEVAEDNSYYRIENGCLIESATDTLVSGCSNSIIPDTITEIGPYAFRGTGIKEMEIPPTVDTIWEHAFENAKNLKNLVLHEGLVYIGYAAFKRCNSLECVSIPETVETIEGEAFNECGCSIIVPKTDHGINAGRNGQFVEDVFNRDNVYTNYSSEQELRSLPGFSDDNSDVVVFLNCELEKSDDVYFVKSIYVAFDETFTIGDGRYFDNDFIYRTDYGETGIAPQRNGYEFCGWGYTPTAEESIFPIQEKHIVYSRSSLKIDCGVKKVCFDYALCMENLLNGRLYAIWKKL